jgi:hypothetical protein
MIEQLDFLDDFFETTEVQRREIQELEKRQDKLRKGLFERLNKQQKLIEELTTAIDFLYMERQLISESNASH